jgi:hypothetical protein
MVSIFVVHYNGGKGIEEREDMQERGRFFCHTLVSGISGSVCSSQAVPGELRPNTI